MYIMWMSAGRILLLVGVLGTGRGTKCLYPMDKSTHTHSKALRQNNGSSFEISLNSSVQVFFKTLPKKSTQ